jgi:hypothetical protein
VNEKYEYTPCQEVVEAFRRYFTSSYDRLDTMARMRELQIELLEIHIPDMDPESAARAQLTALWLDQELQQPGKTPPWRGLAP